MSSYPDLSDIEARAAAIDLPLATLLRSAKVHISTWYRWKAGDYQPRYQSWARIQKALARRERAMNGKPAA